MDAGIMCAQLNRSHLLKENRGMLVQSKPSMIGCWSNPQIDTFILHQYQPIELFICLEIDIRKTIITVFHVPSSTWGKIEHLFWNTESLDLRDSIHNIKIFSKTKKKFYINIP